MIWLTRLDGSPIMVNDDQILAVEVVSDTIVAFQNGERMRVLESSEELLRRVAAWRQRIAVGPLFMPETGTEG